jgi:hypothetical protein
MYYPLVSIITVNYNQAGVTRALLDSIRRQHWPTVEVIVVDNGSVADPIPALTAEYPEVRGIRSDRNLGFAGGNQLGVDVARGEYLFLLNNDTEVTPDCLEALVRFCEQHPGVGAVSPLLCYFPAPDYAGSDLIQYAGMTRVSDLTGRNHTVGALQPDRGQFKTATRTAYAHGAALFFPRATLERAGFLAHDFFLYYEELDWCERIQRAGLELWVLPTVRVYHKESFTTGRMGALKTYFSFRNRMLFMRRNRQRTLWKFHAYLLAVIVPKTLLGYALRRDTENLSAVWAALRWYFLGVKNRFEALI